MRSSQSIPFLSAKSVLIDAFISHPHSLKHVPFQTDCPRLDLTPGKALARTRRRMPLIGGALPDRSSVFRTASPWKRDICFYEGRSPSA
jgi:hypothetical protein